MPLTVAFVTGVTPGKWERIWRERHMPALELVPSEQDAALAALRDGTAAMAFLRDVTADDEFHAIPLYRERPVVVVPKDHAAAAFDELTLADLADEIVLEGQGADTVELVAANVGVAIMPQSVARALSRKDVTARFLSDASDTGISLVWAQDPASDEHEATIQSFIGVVRGRSVNSSRG